MNVYIYGTENMIRIPWFNIYGYKTKQKCI